MRSPLATVYIATEVLRTVDTCYERLPTVTNSTQLFRTAPTSLNESHDGVLHTQLLTSPTRRMSDFKSSVCKPGQGGWSHGYTVREGMSGLRLGAIAGDPLDDSLWQSKSAAVNCACGVCVFIRLPQFDTCSCLPCRLIQIAFSMMPPTVSHSASFPSLRARVASTRRPNNLLDAAGGDYSDRATGCTSFHRAFSLTC
jgi:hypothetical protein